MPRPRRPPLLVVVTGPPASGKTTIARELGDRCRLPLLEKDPLKELLFDTLGAGGRARSREIGGAAYALLFDTIGRLLRGGTSLVVEANFAADTAEAGFGGLPPARLLQVYAFAPPELVLERFTARAGTRDRHDGHADIAALPEVERGLASGRCVRSLSAESSSSSTRRRPSTSDRSLHASVLCARDPAHQTPRRSSPSPTRRRRDGVVDRAAGGPALPARGPGYSPPIERIAVLGNLCSDVVAGAAPRSGGGAYYAARAFAALGRHDVTITAACAAADAVRLAPPLVALGLPTSVITAGRTTAYSFHYEGDRRVMRQEAVGDPWTPQRALAAAGDAGWVYVAALTRSDFPLETLAALAHAAAACSSTRTGSCARRRSGRW